MTFLQWLHDQRGRPDRVGDFARDWVMDRERPRAPRLVEMVAYLEDHGACEAALRASIAAWREWLVALHSQV